jgi:hypothetical protein
MPTILDAIRDRLFPPPEPSILDRREQRTFMNGSPFYTYELPILAFGAWTGALNVIDLFPDAEKYEPLDYIEVTNNDAVDLMLECDTRETFPVPAGTIRGRVDKPFRTFRLYNQDAAVNTIAGQVHIIVQRRPTSIDRWARGERK